MNSHTMHLAVHILCIKGWHGLAPSFLDWVKWANVFAYMDLQKNEIGFSEVLHLRLTMGCEHV